VAGSIQAARPIAKGPLTGPADGEAPHRGRGRARAGANGIMTIDGQSGIPIAGAPPLARRKRAFLPRLWPPVELNRIPARSFVRETSARETSNCRDFFDFCPIFLRFLKDDRLNKDEAGVELLDLHIARLEAVRAIAGIGAGMLPTQDARRLAFDIGDRDLPLLRLTLAFEEVALGQ
jgi:hypothetical protein